MRVIADTGVNIQLQINRLDNYYMLLVPINLIAVSPPLTRRGQGAQCPVASSQVVLCAAIATHRPTG